MTGKYHFHGNIIFPLTIKQNNLTIGITGQFNGEAG
jgi:hypothetical protein